MGGGGKRKKTISSRRPEFRPELLDLLLFTPKGERYRKARGRDEGKTLTQWHRISFGILFTKPQKSSESKEKGASIGLGSQDTDHSLQREFEEKWP